MTWYPFPNVPVVAQAYLLKALLIAILVTGALGAGGGFYAGKEWAEGRAAQAEVKSLHAEIESSERVISNYRTAVSDGATHLISASRALEISATHYAEERDDALARFDAAATTLQAKLDRRPDLALCLFGTDILQDVNDARSGRPAGGAAGTAPPAAGAGPGAARPVPVDAAAGQRRRRNDGRSADP